MTPVLSQIQVNKDVKYCVCGGLLTSTEPLLTKIVDKVCALLSPPKQSNAMEATLHNIQIGTTVTRRIRMHQMGVVTHITYAWGTVKYIKQVWVRWIGKPEATPYALTELLVVTLH